MSGALTQCDATVNTLAGIGYRYTISGNAHCHIKGTNPRPQQQITDNYL